MLHTIFIIIDHFHNFGSVFPLVISFLSRPLLLAAELITMVTFCIIMLLFLWGELLLVY